LEPLRDLGFACEFREKEREMVLKEKKVSGRNREHWKRSFGGFIFILFFKYKSLLVLGGFGRVYMTSSNLIYVVIIFLKLS